MISFVRPSVSPGKVFEKGASDVGLDILILKRFEVEATVKYVLRIHQETHENDHSPKSSADRYQPHTKQSLRLWLRLLDTTTVVEKAIRSYLKSNCDSTLPRFDIMAALDRAAAPVTMTELSERLLVSNGNVTGVVARLVQDGLVARQADESDRRTQRVSLTSRGKRPLLQWPRSMNPS